MLFLLKVDGKSMSPSLEPGDFVLASRLYLSLKPNDIIIVNHPIYSDIIKRIDRIDENNQLWLKGDNIYHSVSSEKMGAIDKKQLKGKVIYSIRRQ